MSKYSGNATNSSSFLNPLEKETLYVFETCWKRFR